MGHVQRGENRCGWGKGRVQRGKIGVVIGKGCVQRGDRCGHREGVWLWKEIGVSKRGKMGVVIGKDGKGVCPKRCGYRERDMSKEGCQDLGKWVWLWRKGVCPMREDR